MLRTERIPILDSVKPFVIKTIIRYEYIKTGSLTCKKKSNYFRIT